MIMDYVGYRTIHGNGAIAQSRWSGYSHEFSVEITPPTVGMQIFSLSLCFDEIQPCKNQAKQVSSDTTFVFIMRFEVLCVIQTSVSVTSSLSCTFHLDISSRSVSFNFDQLPVICDTKPEARSQQSPETALLPSPFQFGIHLYIYAIYIYTPSTLILFLECFIPSSIVYSGVQIRRPRRCHGRSHLDAGR